MVQIISQQQVDGIIHPQLGISRANWEEPSMMAYSHLHMDRMMPLSLLEPSAKPQQLPRAILPLNLSEMRFNDPFNNRAMDGDQFLNRRLYNDALLVFHRGQVIHESYRNGMHPDDHHLQHSTTKSFMAMLVAIAIEEGKMSPDSLFSSYLPELKEINAWREVTLQHVMDMAVGMDYHEDYSRDDCPFYPYARAVGYYPAEDGEEPVGARAWMLDNLTTSIAAPGQQFNYCSPLTNALGMAVSEAYQRPCLELLEEKLFQRVGTTEPGWVNTDGFGVPIMEGQMSLTLEDFARWGLLMVNQGRNLAGEQIIPRAFIDDTVAVSATSQQAFAEDPLAKLYPTGQYRNQFWVLNPQARQFTMLGIHGQFAWYDLNRELMICGYGSYPVQDEYLLNLVLDQLWSTIARETDKR